MKMRPSRVLKKLRAGEVVSCFNVHLDAQVSEIAGMAGFDCLWIDNEHMAQDYSNIQAHIWAAKSHDVDVMVRVPRGSYSDYIKPLELDASGIMVPHIMGIDDARKVVQMTRFHPIGLRPLDGGNADGGYTTIDYADYLPQANKERFVMVQIEDPEPLDDLDAIAALDGIDMLFFGPADFSQGIGAPGDWNHPKLIEARKRVAAVAVKHGKFAGIPGNMDNLDELVEMGYRFIAIGADVIGVGEYCRNLIDGFSKKINERVPNSE
ncbi:MAG: aldolase [Cyclobacteriaceae bacterium]|nr:aldolase [Cyclobacteriaceae bacterium]